MITENLSTLKIHKLTQKQYQRELENNNIDENALYLTPDEEIDFSGYATLEDLAAKADISDVKAIEDMISSMNHIVASDDGNGIITLGVSALTQAEGVAF